MVALDLDDNEYPILIFRIYITATAPASDVRPSERGAPYGDFRLPSDEAVDEPVGNSRATAYDFCDDRLYQDTVRSTGFLP